MEETGIHSVTLLYLFYWTKHKCEPYITLNSSSWCCMLGSRKQSTPLVKVKKKLRIHELSTSCGVDWKVYPATLGT